MERGCASKARMGTLSVKGRKRVGLALGGGVVHGIAHAGVLSVLVQAGIPIDCVSGSSAGSLIGAFYSAGVPVERILEIGENIRWRKVASPVWPRRGFVSFDKMARWVAHELGDIRFEDLKIPFVAVATDMATGQPVRQCEGRLAPAVQASCSVPGFITPVEINGRLLADGSLADTVPVSVLREMGADYVIGVDILPPSLRLSWGPFGFGFTALEILVQRAGNGIDSADCLICPELAGKTYLRFSKAKEFVALGKKAALEKIDIIREGLGLG
jgi:NTE family protein